MADLFEVTAVEKHIRMSPRKVRLVANLVRGKSVDQAIGILKMTPKGAAPEVEKAINSAASNATQNYGLVREDLIVTTIYADEGPRLKRMKAGARGRYKPIMKRSAHITVGVAERKNKTEEK
ncbi:MAG: 50S ribosomal protein L22 [Chloroflexi bacterium]|nr:50S ribosomal protein L22 [Chloroflexota bacterium]MCL5950519.1 50S ribosomal protein L22 [Chloroflexota bacterium]